MSTPSITPAQIGAVVQALVQALAGVLLAFLGDFTDEQKVAVIGVFNAFGAVIGALILYADAHIRGKRADNADKIKPPA